MQQTTQFSDELVNTGVVSAEALGAAQELARRKGLSLEEALLRDPKLSTERLIKAKAAFFQLPVAEQSIVGAPLPEVFQELPRSFFMDSLIFPLTVEAGAVTVATARPDRFEAVDWLAVWLQRPVSLVLAPAADVREAINLVFLAASREDGQSLQADLAGDADQPAEIDLLDAGEDAPVIRTLNRLLSEALQLKSSDIHIEPAEKEFVVRYRVDGVLEEGHVLPKGLASPLISRIKVLSHLDIAERRLPQDGRMKIVLADRPVDIRVSVLPTAHGERVVLRLLEREQVLLGLGEVGLLPEELAVTRRLMTRSNGLFLVTGPTGSGKTTTLYAALQAVDPEQRNVITLEDPVEYQIPGISQIQVNPKIDFTFARGLRSVLRQDPDVIMVGEIRDRETAEMALQASLTGHFVLSTLHTNDAASAVARLNEMGIEPFLLSTSLLAVCAQRLVRKLCPSCRRPEPAENDEALLSSLPPGVTPPRKLWSAVGCEACRHTGYVGRLGVFELLEVTESIRQGIMQEADAVEFKRRARDNGFRSMLESGLVLVENGHTSLAEVLRVTLTESL